MENDNALREQQERQSIDRYNAELREQNTRYEEQIREHERLETERRNAERLRKEDERRKEQRKQKEQQQIEEQRKQREREFLDNAVGGGTDDKKLEDYLVKLRQLEIKANREGTGARKEQPYKPPEKDKASYLKTIQTYENLKKNVEQLDKVNKNLETIKDTRARAKYETSKQSLENKICETLDIKKDKPKFLQSKKEVETSFREKVQRGIDNLEKRVEVAKTKIAEMKKEPSEQAFQPVENRENARTITRENARTITPQNKARGR